MCHVAVRPTPVGPSPGVAGTHPPTHHPPPTTYPGVFGKFPGYLEVPSVFWKVPGTFGEVLDVFEKFPGCSEVPSVFWKVPGTFGEVPNVFVMFSPIEV